MEQNSHSLINFSKDCTYQVPLTVDSLHVDGYNGASTRFE